MLPFVICMVQEVKKKGRVVANGTHESAAPRGTSGETSEVSQLKDQLVEKQTQLAQLQDQQEELLEQLLKLKAINDVRLMLNPRA